MLLKESELPVGELASSLRLPQPATSKHLRVLREVGLVYVRQAGKQRLYGLDARGLRPIHEWTGGFERFWSESLDRLNEYVQELRQEEQSNGS
jgi:DNA-binding transcriptional ArsR family regulator